MVRAAAYFTGVMIVLSAPARAQPYPEGDTLQERQRWAREHPDYKPFDIPLSAEDRAKYVACEDDWVASCDAMRERYQNKAAAAIGGDKLPDAELSVQQKWARQNADWKPLGVAMSEQDRNNYVICVEQPQWEGCAKIKDKYAKKAEETKELAANGAPKPKAKPGAAGSAATEEDAQAPAEGDGGGAGGEAKEPPPGAEAAARARAGGERAMSGARGLGDALKKELREDAGGAPGGPGGAGKGGKPADGARDEKELFLAASSNPGALAALGLVVGRDASGRPSFRRADGTPATAQDLAALRARLSSEPLALMRRPDFFAVLPRPRFEQLKTDYRGRPELRTSAFRDIALSPAERDFERSASCAALSGDCAPDAKESYRKGELVPPEELAAIHRRLHGDPDDDFIDAGAGDEWEAEAAAAAGAAAIDGAGGAEAPPSRRRGVLGAIERLAGRGEAPKGAAGGPGASKAAARAWGEVPGAAIQALESGRNVMSAAGAFLFLLAAGLLLRRST